MKRKPPHPSAIRACDLILAWHWTGIGFAPLRTLAVLEKYGPQTAQDIAARLKVTYEHVNQCLKRLVKHGYARRCPNKRYGDSTRPRYLYTLSPKDPS